MPLCDLCEKFEISHNQFMRLPQASRILLSFRSLFVALLAAGIAFLLPVSARGATLQLLCSPASLRFGSVTVGKTESLLIALTNAGKTSITISATSVSDSAFQVSGLKLPVEVAAGQSVNLSMIFTPKTDGYTGGEVTFISTASNSKAILELQGAGEKTVALTAAPSSLSFGDVNVGTAETHSVVVTNTSALDKVVTTWQALGSGFSVKGPGLPVVLGAHKSVTLDVTFDPKVAGEAGGSVLILLPGLVVPLSGTGVSTAIGKLLTSPASLNFGSADVGTETAKDAAITATGGSVTISSATSSNSEFSISGTSFPLTLKAGESASLKVVFSPTKSGVATGTLTLTSNASDTHATESLSGTAVSAEYSVDLSWKASSSKVTGYNVYRGTAAGEYSKINSELDSATNYTDKTVVPGNTYYYAATSVNSAGEESGYSSPIEVKIP
jgi:hypothetical protein